MDLNSFSAESPPKCHHIIITWVRPVCYINVFISSCDFCFDYSFHSSRLSMGSDYHLDCVCGQSFLQLALSWSTSAHVSHPKSAWPVPWTRQNSSGKAPKGIILRLILWSSNSHLWQQVWCLSCRWCQVFQWRFAFFCLLIMMIRLFNLNCFLVDSAGQLYWFYRCQHEFDGV